MLNLTANFRAWFSIEKCLLVLSYKPVEVLRSFKNGFDTYSSLVWGETTEKMVLKSVE